MAAVGTVSTKLDQSINIGQSNNAALVTLSSAFDSMRQQISDLLVGAGVPDSVAAQVDQLLLLQQVTQNAITAALAKIATPLPPPSTTPPLVPTISLAVNTLAATAPGSVQLVPTISDPSNLVTKVECYRSGALISTKIAAPFGYTDSGLPAGTYNYTEKLYYSGGALPITSNAVQVTIAAATQQGPVTIDPIT